ncbi:hypothetical protein [Leptothoe spongobia]|uniref:Uncharacterized protein n=1 Tax=Leptothoe spongobia TAU-MAC 1115 TaxID=1967444 RepID=A0A947DI20_9CYAN|nr:hypothetical protein [Leptothoe spongobia]MBT9316935.1 hypothetical protein [Leptothoe spongobia TAU-MAC 1115]
MGLSRSNSPTTTQVKLLVSPASGRIPWSLLSWLILGSGAVVLVAVILSGARLIIDPYSPNWLKTAFPGLVNSFEAAPQTANEIRAEMRSQGLTSGLPIAWPNVDEPTAWFYPVLDKDNKAIKELWVYRVQGDQLQRVEQISIRPMKESFITNPLVGTASQVASVDSDATLSSGKLMPSQSADGPWLLLEGQRRYGNTVMRYGQILSYQSHSQRLHRLLNWSSPTDQPPQWQTSETGHQLVIDQTVGLRPSFLLYQLVPNNPPQLQEISLYRSVYDSDQGSDLSPSSSDLSPSSSDLLSPSLYDKALKLAQGAVWSHSLQMMQSAKIALEPDWSSAAQTQLDLIELHAKHTKAQTEQTFSSQQQHILAYLMDGQWDKALTTLEDNPAIYESTLKRLEYEFDSLWRGVSTHLQVHPRDQATQIWGALLVTARQSPEAGQAWLKKKTRSKQLLERLQAVGKTQSLIAAIEVEPSKASSDSPTANVSSAANVSNAVGSLPSTTTTGRYLSLVGQAQSMATSGEGWLRSQTLPTPVPGQTWYQINVQLLQDSSGWGLPPVSITAANFWAETRSLRRQVQLFRGNQPVGGITVHGIKATGSDITLLAIGPEIEGLALVTTGNSLRWLNTLPWQTAPMPAIFTAANPVSTNNESVTADQSLATAGLDPLIPQEISQHLGLSSEQMTQLYPHLHYASLNLVGDGATEHLFTISHGLPSELALTPGKTIIFSNTGEILYSDIRQEQSLVALTDGGSGQSTMLLVEQPGRYDLIGL